MIDGCHILPDWLKPFIASIILGAWLPFHTIGNMASEQLVQLIKAHTPVYP